ncbi:hypothetical protein TVAG_334750 [Trichomonas vaginalis G3]|uniref:Uncharacterized protein n=1 Tax=Trichomonas vaginalis (strain ATCC PRA-98 / G3) TaxID=412133 RepID=A2GA41_TRIV3|nr:hypothetical protein TVAGG3_0722720 [Trichomonas vaginalis G3]EAX85976.1 hypothetical protein TVAG_334750 [Trichomonas vaginalis G3]KAI5510695.1 hypothetical protein TVAGG3_0722720 [Trichomonas vaginalis G3]|eukprot:XP_001298906.1 hypothetical protein [Trichomonas vaginalis G3]
MCPDASPPNRKYSDVELDIESLRMIVNPTQDQIDESLDNDIGYSQFSSYNVITYYPGIFIRYFYRLLNHFYENRDDINPYDETHTNTENNINIEGNIKIIPAPNNILNDQNEYATVPDPEQIQKDQENNNIEIEELNNALVISNASSNAENYANDTNLPNPYSESNRPLRNLELSCFSNENMLASDIIFYAIVTLLPFLGILLYCFIKPKRPRVAFYILNYSMVCFILFGVALFVFLL